ncbi:MAG: AAA family ATPase [Egibacteraceae bacterium]
MAGEPGPNGNTAGLAVSFAVTTFGPGSGEPAEDLPGLPFEAHCEDLITALHGIGYRVEIRPDPPAAAIGSQFRTLITAGEPGARIIHVLSHGKVTATRSLYVVGSDGKWLPETEVGQWLKAVEDFPGVPHTLFLLDLCRGGTAALAPWLREMLDGRNRAWVIAACRPDEAAYDARFTRASAKVLSALKNGLLDVYAAHRFVPITTVATEIAREVAALVDAEDGWPQQVIGNPLSITTPVHELELPFFANPRPVPGPLADVRLRADPVVGPYLDEVLDLDPGHWQERSAGYPYVASRSATGCFAGRKRQLRELVNWLESSSEVTSTASLRVVTGSPGSGKSALLGVLVCAAHRELSKQTQQLWTPVFRADAPSVNPSLAAVHTRQRDCDAVIASLARQLDLESPRDRDRSGRWGAVSRRSIDLPSRAGRVWTALELHEAIKARPAPPVIIVDAIDEAVDPELLVNHLLLPLAEMSRPDGRPAARLLVGVRRGALLTSLAAVADPNEGLTDLDAVPLDELAEDLREYVAALLRLSDSYGDASHKTARDAFANAVATALTQKRQETGHAEWGEFLVAAVYTHHLLSREESVLDPIMAEAIGVAVPGSLPKVLELDLADRGAAGSLLRRVLAVLACAQGQGMPLGVLTRLVAARQAAGVAAGEEEVLRTLDQAHFYLRQTPDTDGRTLYRLFHQGLADYLLDHSGDGPSTSSSEQAALMLETLLAPFGPGEARRWHAAEPYVLQHAAGHALAAGRLADLITDQAFLVHADPRFLLPALGRLHLIDEDASGETAENANSCTAVRLARAVYRTSGHRHRALPASDRRDVLSVDAARWGAGELAESLNRVSVITDEEPFWRPGWASGSSVTPAHLATLIGHERMVNAVTCAIVGDRLLAVTGSDDKTLRIWDLAEQRPVGEPMPSGQGPVVAIARTMLKDRPCVVTGGADGTVRVWDLAAPRPVSDPFQVHDGPVTDVACAWLEGRAVAVTAGVDGTVRVWDLADGHLPPVVLLDRFPVERLACTQLGGRPIVVTGSADGMVRVWDLANGSGLDRPLAGHDGLVTGVVCTRLEGQAVAVTAGVDGTVRIWDLAADELSFRVPLTGHVGAVRAVDCVTVAKRPVVVTAGDDHTVRMWDLIDREPLTAPLTGHRGPVQCVAVGELNGRPVAVTAGEDTTIHVWDLTETPALGSPSSGHTRHVQAVTCSLVEERPMVVTAGDDSTVRVWDLERGTLIRQPMTGHGGSVLGITCSQVGGRPVAISVGDDKFAWIWDLEAMAPLGKILTGHRGPVIAVASASVRSAPVAVTVGWDRTVRMCMLEKENLPGILLGARADRHQGEVRAVACTLWNERPVAVTVGAESAVRLWDLLERQLTDVIPTGHNGGVRAVVCAIVSGRPVAVTIGDDATVQMLDLTDTSIPAVPLAGPASHAQAIACAVVAGRPVAITGDGDGTIRMWDLLDRRHINSFTLPDEVRAVAIDTAGRLIAGFGYDVVVLQPMILDGATERMT